MLEVDVAAEELFDVVVVGEAELLGMLEPVEDVEAVEVVGVELCEVLDCGGPTRYTDPIRIKTTAATAATTRLLLMARGARRKDLDFGLGWKGNSYPRGLP